MSYDEDVDGQLLPGERFSPLEANWDPMSKRRNLADSKWRSRGRWMARSEAEERWPELKNHEFNESEFMWDEEESEDEPHNAARAHFYENDSRQWYNKNKDEVFILHFQWWDLCPTYRVDAGGGRLVELSEAKYEKLKEYIEQSGLRSLRQMKRQWYYAFIAGPLVLEKGINSWPDGFTLMCATGKRDAMKNSWFGIVRPLIQPQQWSNKFLSDLQDMIVSNRQGGAFVEAGALIDPRTAEDDWATNSLILLQDGAIANNKILERNPPAMPPALDRMIQFCLQAIPEVSGINQEFMGYADRDQANVLELQRKRSAVNVLATMFSSLRKYRKDRAQATLYFIREFMNDGRLIRVVGGDGTEQYIPLALDPEVEQYDIIIDESTSSPNQKEETFSVLMALAPHLAAAGIPTPPDLVDYLPLPSSLTSKWKEMLQPSEQPNPQEMAIAQAAQAEATKDMADAEYKKAQAQKAQAEAEATQTKVMAVRGGLLPVEEL